jgi:trans-aconitate methyltransferase
MSWKKSEEGVMEQNSSGNYPIEHRPGEIERLGIQAEALAGETQVMLGLIGVKPGWKCIDLGCGPGGITTLLSNAVGDAGTVIGIDMDEGFLEYAARNAPPNVLFKRADAYATGLPRHQFDLVHMRFVAGTSGNTDVLLKEALALAKPGGVLALQEPDLSTLRCFPPDSAFSNLRDYLIGCFSGVGADATGAHYFYAKLRQLGLRDVAYRTAMPGVRSFDPLVDYLPATVESVRRTVLRLGLATEERLNQELGACRRHLRQSDVVFTMFTVVQVWCRTPN